MNGLSLRFTGRLFFPFIVEKRLGESAQHLGRGFEHGAKLRFIAAFDIVAQMILQLLELAAHVRDVLARVHFLFKHGTLLGVIAAIRSEEHTSELQSLMRISYAVFCLKKKKQSKLRS